MPAKHQQWQSAPPYRPDPAVAATWARVAPRLLLAALGAAVMCGAVFSTSARAAAGATVNATANASFGTILTDAGGFALYTLPSDVNGKSGCAGSCAVVWPALTVPAGTTPSAGPGVPGTVGESLQSNGTYQVTYNGSPLYTFVSDTAPGQASGNNIAGFTVVVLPTPALPTATTPPAVPTTTAVASVPTPTTAPRPTSSPTTAPTGAAVGAPVAAPATAAAAPAASAAGSNASNVSGTATPTAPATRSLAVTGPGTGLVWMVVVGAGLVAVSLSTLAAIGDRRRLRQALRRASRTGLWFLGR